MQPAPNKARALGPLLLKLGDDPQVRDALLRPVGEMQPGACCTGRQVSVLAAATHGRWNSLHIPPPAAATLLKQVTARLVIGNFNAIASQVAHL